MRDWICKWWYLFIVLLVGGGIGWGLGELLISVIDKRIEMFGS